MIRIKQLFLPLALTTQLLIACSPAVVYREPVPDPLSMHKMAVPVANGAIYQPDTNRYLFEDRKARRVGDLITVILDERTIAAKSASTSSSKETGLELPAPTVFGKVPTLDGVTASTSVSSGTAFNGSGDSKQSNSLFGNITVAVVDVLSNGNLVVKGEKLLTLNNGKEVVSVSGIVRQRDVTPENTVVSNLIADAEIVYSGRGLIADSNKAGWVTRMFNSAYWPF
ncbi:flagellar basal body L-ring protein [Chromatiales bacterium (ex Bugula neritina AB1)]|nr:flagellar basal body L-ring protein [Chromatiales bacterium (ex Bugula neritina AB1)]